MVYFRISFKVQSSVQPIAKAQKEVAELCGHVDCSSTYQSVFVATTQVDNIELYLYDAERGASKYIAGAVYHFYNK